MDEHFLSEDTSAPAAADFPKREDRRLVELSAYLIRSDKSIVDVKIGNLSYDGCGVHTVVPLTAGEKVKLTVLGRGSMNATVRWYKARKAGLLFRFSRARSHEWPRKADRVAVGAELLLRRSGRIGFRVNAFDVTRFGCRCEFVDRPAIYERVWAKFDGLEALQATVCWIEDSNIGLMFANAIHPAVFELLLMQLQPLAAPLPPLPDPDAEASAEPKTDC